MNNAERIKLLELSFDYVETILKELSEESDETVFRSKVKAIVDTYLLSDYLDDFHKRAVLEAHKKIENMTFDEILDMIDLLSE